MSLSRGHGSSVRMHQSPCCTFHPLLSPNKRQALSWASATRAASSGCWAVTAPSSSKELLVRRSSRVLPPPTTLPAPTLDATSLPAAHHASSPRHLQLHKAGPCMSALLTAVLLCWRCVDIQPSLHAGSLDEGQCNWSAAIVDVDANGTWQHVPVASAAATNAAQLALERKLSTRKMGGSKCSSCSPGCSRLTGMKESCRR